MTIKPIHLLDGKQKICHAKLYKNFLPGYDKISTLLN